MKRIGLTTALLIGIGIHAQTPNRLPYGYELRIVPKEYKVIKQGNKVIVTYNRSEWERSERLSKTELK